MVNVWKIGAWPGGPGKKWSQKNKNDFINNYAIPKGYVAIDFEDCNTKDCKNPRDPVCRHCTKKKEFINFKENIKPKDIVLLYNKGYVYAGEVIKNYNKYFYGQGQHHRIEVSWFDKNKHPAKLTWNDTVHEVLREDFNRIENGSLNNRLKGLLKNQIVEPNPKYTSPARRKRADRPLGEKNDSDIENIIRTNSILAKNLHNQMTNRLTKLCDEVNYRILEGDYDARIENYDGTGKDLLIEVKSNTDRSHLRLAVGQLFDYRRSLKRRAATDIAVLLPEKPEKESIDFLKDVGIHILWFINTELQNIKGSINLKFM